MDPKHQFAAQYVLSRAAAERREREILASSSLGITSDRHEFSKLMLKMCGVATLKKKYCTTSYDADNQYYRILMRRPCAVQERVWACWAEVNLEDRKTCNNHQCARHRRPIRIAAAATEDCRRPVVNLVRYDTCSTSTTYKSPAKYLDIIDIMLPKFFARAQFVISPLFVFFSLISLMTKLCCEVPLV